jgi:phosphoglucomutase
LEYPEKIGGHHVISVRDLTAGYDSEKANKSPTLPVSKSSQMITFKLENGVVFTLRTSGTEPKVKYYSEIKGADKEKAQKDLDATIESMIRELLDPEKNGLIPQSDK